MKRQHCRYSVRFGVIKQEFARILSQLVHSAFDWPQALELTARLQFAGPECIMRPLVLQHNAYNMPIKIISTVSSQHYVAAVIERPPDIQLHNTLKPLCSKTATLSSSKIGFVRQSAARCLKTKLLYKAPHNKLPWLVLNVQAWHATECCLHPYLHVIHRLRGGNHVAFECKSGNCRAVFTAGSSLTHMQQRYAQAAVAIRL